ncbi:hypothetical protein LZ31DRAFT_103074 [Colletotrichum somersetense]|nr:hypothetical protein LZ31DRAFT_103074 [Colletotrichum somersetense]
MHLLFTFYSLVIFFLILGVGKIPTRLLSACVSRSLSCIVHYSIPADGCRARCSGDKKAVAPQSRVTRAVPSVLNFCGSDVGISTWAPPGPPNGPCRNLLKTPQPAPSVPSFQGCKTCQGQACTGCLPVLSTSRFLLHHHHMGRC